jgi:uncharacterized protein
MIFDIEKISEEGTRFSIILNKDEFEVNQAGLSINIDIAISGSLTRVGDDFYLNGKVRTDVISSCSRCLEKLSYPINSDLKSHFLPSDVGYISPGEVEIYESDIDTEVYKNKEIDLTQSVRDAILLSVPVVCLCKVSCKGICLHCGKNLNHGICKCINESFIDPRLQVLKVLKKKSVEGE